MELRGVSWDDVHGEDELLAFRCEASTNSRSDIEIDVGWVDELHEPRIPKSFESSAIWRVFHAGDALVFDFSSPLVGPQPYKRMCVSSDFSDAEVMLSRSASERCGKISPLEYPACELLIINYLAHHGLGVEVHGCGLIDRDTGGHLFLGHSGAGKSTTARLWESFRAPEILSDDRILLRLYDGQLWMYGTPWHGEAAFASPAKVRLDRIHLLRHGAGNKFSCLPQARAVAEIFARSFPPFHSASGVEGSIEFIKRALDAVPCNEFEFLPDASSVTAVLEEYNHDS
ncbi:MAG: hypothetical protein ACRD3P_16715 [Terriglobales bacterium]